MPSTDSLQNRMGNFGFGQDPLLGQQLGLNREVMEAQANLEVIRQIKDQKIALKEEEKEKMLEIEQQYLENLKHASRAQMEITIMSAQSIFGDLATMSEAFAGKQSGIYKAMFAASKAFAIAESIVKIQQGIAAAAAQPWPLNLAAIASVVSATANIVSTIQSVKLTFDGERAAGGPVQAGKAYLVGEKGPEPFIPRTNGTIMSNEDWMGKGSTTIVNVINQTDSRIEVSERERDGVKEIDVLVKRVKKELASDVHTGSGDFVRALDRNYKSQRGQAPAR